MNKNIPVNTNVLTTRLAMGPDNLRAHFKDNIEAMRKASKALPGAWTILRTLAKLPAAEDVISVSVGSTYGATQPLAVYITLKSSAQASPFVRQAAMALGVPFKKEQSYDGTALNCVGIVGAILVHISGYLPKSCAVVEEEVEVPARVETRRMVVCAGGSDEATAPIEP